MQSSQEGQVDEIWLQEDPDELPLYYGGGDDVHAGEHVLVKLTDLIPAAIGRNSPVKGMSLIIPIEIDSKSDVPHNVDRGGRIFRPGVSSVGGKVSLGQISELVSGNPPRVMDIDRVNYYELEKDVYGTLSCNLFWEPLNDTVRKIFNVSMLDANFSLQSNASLVAHTTTGVTATSNPNATAPAASFAGITNTTAPFVVAGPMPAGAPVTTAQGVLHSVGANMPVIIQGVAGVAPVPPLDDNVAFKTFLQGVMGYDNQPWKKASSAGIALERFLGVKKCIDRLDQLGWGRKSGGYAVPHCTYFTSSYTTFCTADD